MINFCHQVPRSRPARKALKNVLRSLGCSASTGRPLFIQPPPWGPAPVPESEPVRCPDRTPGAGGWETYHVPRRTWKRQQDRRVPEELCAIRMWLDKVPGGADHRAGPCGGAPAEYRGNRPYLIWARRPSKGRAQADAVRGRRRTARRGSAGGAGAGRRWPWWGSPSRPWPGGGSGYQRAARSSRTLITTYGRCPARADPRRRRVRQGGDPAGSGSRRCCAGRPGTSAPPPTWPLTAASSRPGFPRRHVASWPRPCAGTLTD